MTAVVVRRASDIADAEATVIIPLGRFDRYVDEAVGSILAQEDVRLHVVLALDGITLPPDWDRGAHPSVSVVRTDRSVGIAATLNNALDHSTTDLVARMDGDDVSHPRRIRRQIDFLADHPEIAVVGTYAVEIDPEGSVIGEWHGPRKPWSVAATLQVRNPVIHPSVMFRHAVVSAVGGYREDAEGIEDYELWLRVIRVAKVAVMGEELLRYRRHPHQVTWVARSLSHFDVLLASKVEGRGAVATVAVTVVHRLSTRARVVRDRLRHTRASA